MAEKKDDNLGFWTPGSYIRTVNRPQDSYKVCDVVVECLKDRARLEQRYAQQLNDWSNKWKKITDSRPMYGSVLRAWQCFFSSTERLSTLHSAVSHSLVSEDGGRIRSWQKKAFQKKAFYGFRESHDLKKEFARAQKPWVKRMKKLDKAEHVYHRACEKELKVLEKERQLRTNENQNQRALTKIQNSVEKAQHERERARERYVKVLDSVCSYTPRYMEEMEAVFDQSQEQEGKRIGFLKDTLLSIHSHLDITNNQSVKAVYSDLAHVLTVISEEDDLRWWRNHHGPGMITHWPTLQEWAPPSKKSKHVKKLGLGTGTGTMHEKVTMIGGVQVRALYDYSGEDEDELSFKAGEEFLKVEDEDDQGWCRGVKQDGVQGYYPANYVLPVE